VLALAAVLLAGCPPRPELVEPPPEPVRPEAGPAWNDDDDASPAPITRLAPNRPPRVEVVDRSFAPGQMIIDLLVSDPDSLEISVTVVRFTDEGDEVGATLEGVDGSAVGVLSDGPLDQEPIRVVWLASVDLANGGDLSLRFCPVDAQGNPGVCKDLPPPQINDLGSFCQPGHVEPMSWSGGTAIVPLSGGGCLNYAEQDSPSPSDYAARFLLVLVNPHPDPVVLSAVTTGASTDEDPTSPPESDTPPVPGPPPEPVGCAWQVFEEDIGGHEISWALRSSLGDGALRAVHGATLQALGDHVAVYVDDATPFAADEDCEDETNPIEAGPFTTCHLDEFVQIFDINLVPNITDHFGPLSDVNSDCRIDVVVTHRLNQLTDNSQEPQHQGELVTALTEPETDLVASTFGAPSSEREVLFVASPDPLALWSDVPVPAEEWHQTVAPGVARAIYELVSFAGYRGVVGLGPSSDWTPAQDDWLQDGLSMLAADLCGFGQDHHAEAWTYLDAPDLVSLTADDATFGFEDRGGQYLFASWLYQLFGTADWPLHPEPGDELRGAAQLAARTGIDFDDLVLSWAAATGVSGRRNSAGQQLVPQFLIPNLAEPTFVTVPDPENPLSGELAGADGHQRGFDVRGMNLQHLPDGTIGEVRTTGPDPRIFHPQADFYATLAGGHGVLLVEVGGLAQPTNTLRLSTAGGEDLVGLTVRLNDESPWDRDLRLEQVPGALLTTPSPLDEPWAWLSLDQSIVSGKPRRVIGSIEASETVPLAEGGETGVADLDRYPFALLSVQRLVFEVTRRAAGPDGLPADGDVFLAVLPASDLPDAADYVQWGIGPTPADGPCSDPALFEYPVVMPGFIAAQGNLLPDPVDGPWEPVAPAGSPLLCDEDLDQDGLPDADEPAPPFLAAQIRQRQAENLAGDPGFYDLWEFMPQFEYEGLPFWDHRFIDLDSNEQPDDDLPAVLMDLGAGGRAWATGEEAVLVQILPPGDYVVLVGATDDSTGPYDLTVRIAY